MAKAKKQQGPKAYNVFLSWSGDRSKAAAQALRDWLPIILQTARPWMSESEIEKGSVGLNEVARALDMKVGIICLTPENRKEEWILFEAGALSKTFDDETRVCPYLLGGLRKGDVKPPLSLLQATVADKDDTKKLVRTINRHLDAAVAEAALDELFEMLWPKLDGRLRALPPGAAPTRRSGDDMLEEVLGLVRSIAPQVRDIAIDVENERMAREFQSTLRATNLNFGENLYSGTVTAFRDREVQRQIAKGISEGKKKAEASEE